MNPREEITGTTSTSSSVVVVAICSLPQLRRSLTALMLQDGIGECETLVAVDSRLGSVDELTQIFPHVAFLSREGCNTPIELTTMALERATGDRIVLTEDSCVPSSGWLRTLTGTSPKGRAAVGGAVEATGGISSGMWAFCYVDFFRYMRPLHEGETPTLSVCNISYRRADLEAVRDLWRDGFNENEINGALQQRFGPLWLCPAAEVRVRRDVTFGDAVYERYAFGRLFGSTRIAHSSAVRRAYYAAVAPALPFLLMMRMSQKARQDRALMKQFFRALPAILTMVAAWSWGEWLGYVTARRPQRVTTAPEIQRAGGAASGSISTAVSLTDLSRR